MRGTTPFSQYEVQRRLSMRDTAPFSRAVLTIRGTTPFSQYEV